MSTGADAKTMPGTAELREGFDRAFGEQTDGQRIERARSSRRGVFVLRCANCDGVQFEPGTFLCGCANCGGKDCKGSVDITLAPPLAAENAVNAPIMVDRFMEGAVSTEGIDIGSRAKRREYMRATGVADKSDYGKGWNDRVRASREREVQKLTRETVARAAYEVSKP